MNLPGYDFLDILPLWASIISVVAIVSALGFRGAGIRPWIVAVAVMLYGFGAALWPWIVLGVVVFFFGLPPVRRVLSGRLMSYLDRTGFLPRISRTEQEAIDAGSVWVEGELFSGKPDFNRMMSEPYPGLTEEEQAFIDGPTQELCDLTDDWEVFQQKDLPAAAWDFMKEHRFFGMIIPKEYGGHGFKASANSAVVGKVGSANTALGITVMVTNSLGPAELLIHYGTDEQKKYYLPRLARHEEIPAFALTEPTAGSDAGSITSTGVVFTGDDGKLYLRLNWNKRYITLSSIATVLGLAIKILDPENLLQMGPKPGITCALVKTDQPGIEQGYRHDPMGIPFYNGPTTGKDVVVLLEEAVIGGMNGVGKGWGMLMEALAAGRGISLPATSTSGTKMVARVTGAHAVVRKQFGLSIGSFEGVEEPLARIGGWAYILEAARRYTNGGLDQGIKPPVVTAIMKYNATELFRKAIIDGMDVQGGTSISRGPRNTLAHAYMNAPIGVTVEGANILTRTLMIFGQGAIRCHPFVLKEIDALNHKDVRAFDEVFWSHVALVVRNISRAKLLSLTRGRLASSPVGGPTAVYYKKLAWVSATFAVLSDVTMATLGGQLKRKEMLTGRFADIFSWMYLGTSVLRRYEAEGRPSEDLPFVHWSMQYALTQIQTAFEGIFSNLRIPGFTWLLRGPIALWFRTNRLSCSPKDRYSQTVARVLMTPGGQRDRITSGIHLPTSGSRAVARLDYAMELSVAAAPIASKLNKASRAGKIRRGPIEAMLKAGLEEKIITAEEAVKVREAETVRNDTIQVDSFSTADFNRNAVQPARTEPGRDGAHLEPESSRAVIE